MPGHKCCYLYAHITWRTWSGRGCVTARLVPDVESALGTAAERTSVHILRHAILSDHVHVLVSLRPDTRLSDFVRLAKCISARRANQRSYGALRWGRGFFAGSVCRRHLAHVAAYIERQFERHPDSIPRQRVDKPRAQA